MTIIALSAVGERNQYISASFEKLTDAKSLDSKSCLGVKIGIGSVIKPCMI